MSPVSSYSPSPSTSGQLSSFPTSTQAGPASHDHPDPPPAAVYEALHADDRRAAAIIVGIMLGIFAIGVFLYTYILFSVM